jgi:hypothetical protein
MSEKWKLSKYLFEEYERELLKAHSIDEYGRKKPSILKRKVSDKLNQNVDSFVQQQNHSVSFCDMHTYYYYYYYYYYKIC